jgi:malonyl-CoA O-methyltransferase
MFDLINKKIRQSFSDAATQYEILTSMHNEIGHELVKKVIPIEQCGRILDVGMGTGRMTRRLSYYFPESKVIGMDFASGMIEEAKKKQEKHLIIQADARGLPFQNESIDIIVSNLAYQWIENLTDAFGQCHRSLKQDGVFCITLFGRETFRELFESIDAVSKQECKIKRLASVQNVEQAVKGAGFKNIEVDYERIKTHFPDLKSLLKWIKDIGANCLDKNVFIGKDMLSSVDRYYEEHYKDRLGIYATLEVIWVKAAK